MQGKVIGILLLIKKYDKPDITYSIDYMKMFGTNGIRGVANDYLECNRLIKIGRSIATVLGPGPIAIAMDTRTSSDMIRSAVSAGIMSMGCDIRRLGVIPTPALQYYVKTHKDVSGGVMITASHNPPEFNGVKCVSKDGTECSPDEERAIEDAFDKDLKTVSWERIGSETMIADAGEDYIDSIIDKIDTDLIKRAKLTVCIDCSNGAAYETTPLLLKRLGVKTLSINTSPDGMFPGHFSEPIESNLSELKALVIRSGADLGAAHDGDADRCVFITDKGRYLTGDVSLALLSKNAVTTNKSKKVVTTVATSSMISDVVKKTGGETELTAVGSPIVARKMMENGGIIGGEDNGGIIFADHQYCRDGAMAIVRMIEMIAKYGSLEEQVNELPVYYTIKHVLNCEDIFKEEILHQIKDNHKKENINTIDGVRIDYGDGWVIMRPSGTEPKFRITSESYDQIVARKRADKFKKEFESIYGKLRR